MHLKRSTYSVLSAEYELCHLCLFEKDKQCGKMIFLEYEMTCSRNNELGTGPLFLMLCSFCSAATAAAALLDSVQDIVCRIRTIFFSNQGQGLQREQTEIHVPDYMSGIVNFII